jgi:tRNA(Ile)-lysidine synthase
MILEAVKNTIKKYNLIQDGDRIVVGVSGGPDSVALLYILNNLKKELKISLHVAHLDHMLRIDSHKDRAFVQNLCNKLQAPISTAAVNIKEIAKKGSVEEIARNARLGFLFRVAKEAKAKKIALGHNFDDQAETVMMRILRGAGLYGLEGMLPKRDIAGYQIIRPLIEVRRKEIEAFLRRKNIKARIDITNLQDTYFRNRVRNNLLPLLEKEYNKNIKEVLSNMAQVVGYDYDYLSKIAGKSLNSAKRSSKKIGLKKFSRFHPSIQRFILRLMIAREKGDLRKLTFRHIREVEDLIYNRPANSVVDLPNGVSVIKKKTCLSFYKR